jgi:vesicle coat complex subunit
LKKPSGAQSLVQKVLQEATTNSDNPDIRDRAYVYWRLLSGDLEVAKVRTHFYLPVIVEERMY